MTRPSAPLRRRAMLVAALLPALLAGCTTVPSSSPTVQITQAASRPDEEVGIEPLAPARGETPEEIVRGFIDAAASTTRGHPVAREYLSKSAQSSWSDETGTTIISAGFSAVTGDSSTVDVRAQLVGSVDPRGIFTVATDDVYTRLFSLTKVRGEWRITDPPDGLLMLEPDFARLYDQRNVYFMDPTGQRVVPDPRYLLTGQAQPTALISRAIDGPSPALASGVRNPLGGVQLRGAVTTQRQTVTVDLTGVPSSQGPQLSQMCAQIVWTLDQLQLGRVQILIDGSPVNVQDVPQFQTVEDWSAFDPDATPVGAVGHYLAKGALRTVNGQPAPGPPGTGAYGLTSAAILTDRRSGQPAITAGVAVSPGSATLLVGPYGSALAPVLSGHTLTAPTAAATRSEFWVVRDGAAVVRVPAQGTPQAVKAPTLTSLGRTTVLRLSPDGVRVAVVVDGPAGVRLYVGTVVRSEDGGVALSDFRGIAPSLAQVTDVSWQDAGTLLVLAGDAAEQRTVPYTVSVDGWGLDSVATAGLPNQPTSVGAAPGRSPLVSAGGTIWELSGGIWTTLIRGQEPLPGTAPFYPV